MGKIGTIYKIENTINGKVYIGQTRVGFKKRVKEHLYGLRKNSHNNDYLQRAWNKYGEDNFNFSVVERCRVEELDRLEVKWITYHKNIIGVYNLESGGNKNKTFSRYSLNKLSKASKRNWNNPEYATKMRGVLSKVHRGKNNVNATKVICLNTGEVFETMTEAANKYNLTVNNISEVCRGKKKSTGLLKNGQALQFSYYEEDEKYYLKDISRQKKKVICINTGEVFASAFEASENFGVSRESIYNACIGSRDCVIGDDGGFYQFAYYKENKTYKLKKINKNLIKAPKKVICINTKEVFESTHEASQKYGCQQSKISECCNRKRNYAGKLENGQWLVWRFVEEYDVDEKHTFSKTGEYSNRKHRVRCITTGEVFDTMNLACERYGIHRSTLWRACTGKLEKGVRLKNGETLNFEYA